MTKCPREAVSKLSHFLRFKKIPPRVQTENPQLASHFLELLLKSFLFNSTEPLFFSFEDVLKEKNI